MTTLPKVPWWIIAAVAAVGATRLPDNAYTISLVNLVAISALVAASMRFVMLMGEVSFAIAAFVGVGAYGAGIATTLWRWPFGLALLVGPLVATAASAAFGFITLRIKGPYFMLIGFAFAEAVRIIFTKTTYIGGTSGMVGIFAPRYMDPWLVTFVTSVVAIMLIALYLLERSDFGRVLVAIRDNENIPRTVGINVLVRKVTCFAIAAFSSGVAGTLHAYVNNVISPGDFSFLLACFALAYVKVGGESSILGAISGSIILVLLGSYALGLGAGEQLFYGGAIVLAVLLMPTGLIGLVDKALRRLGWSRAPGAGGAARSAAKPMKAA